ncbi:intercellular adhesion molecule 3 isoform X1 [Ailuropoda melanoleuca]|uniref:intercellular adhesion molecule 3 isoform X1 n=1 Tax=Ailuropoda melanoleuca TaxID=9646 RepID=UPI0014942A7A|nr:intercellular adhesion molecule 3 isoform X1 [Ailuropoda melanoleuca]
MMWLRIRSYSQHPTSAQHTGNGGILQDLPRLAAMVPSGLPPAACGTPLISLLLVCCLLLPGAPGQQFQLRAEVQSPVVPAGGSFLVNCSSDCPNPELITLETSLSKEPVGNGLGWAAFQLSNATTDSQVLCSGFCNRVQMIGSSNIIVYHRCDQFLMLPARVSLHLKESSRSENRVHHSWSLWFREAFIEKRGFPERVELLPLPRWQPVGENFTLRCQVAGGAPRTSLTVVLLRGEEELSRKPAFGEPAEITATVLAGRDDHLANFSCRMELDLRPQGLELFQNSSAPRQLRTFALPVTTPHLVVPRFLEVGTNWSVNCTLDGLFPASEVQVQLALGNQTLNPTVESHGDTTTATATASVEQEGAQEIVCNMTLGSDSWETRENLTIYSFQGPILNLSEPSAPEGTAVTVTCLAGGARVQVALEGVPAAAPGQPAQFQLNATERDDRRIFFCNATLEVDGEILHRNSSVQLRVLYGPKIDQAKCPQRLMWKDKTIHVLQCQARGNPDPQLHCFQEGSGKEVPIGIPFLVRLKHNGTYSCEAASSRGRHTINVVMNVRDRNARAVNIVLGVFVVLGVVTISAALLYVFDMHKRSGVYRVNQGSTSLPLTSKQPEEAVGEDNL